MGENKRDCFVNYFAVAIKNYITSVYSCDVQCETCPV